MTMQHRGHSLAGTHYLSQGSGPALVFVHGAGGNAAVWSHQIAYFSQHYRTVCIDLPGFGVSPPRKMETDPSALGEVITEVLDHLDIEVATLVGQSLGGWFALRAALHAPERVRALVLSCSMAGVSSAPATTAFAAALARAGSAGLTSLTLTDAFRRERPLDAYLFEQLSAFNPPPDFAAIGALFAPDALLNTNELSSFDRPVLMLSGEHDPIWPPTSLEGIRNSFANAQFSVISNSGHSPYFEQPQEFNGALSSFLT